MLRETDLHLPAKGWGRIILAASASRAGTAWTDDGTARQERGLKHRADNETRTIPIPPELVRLLRAHIKRYGTTPDGRIFQTGRGGILQDSGYNEVWAEARQTALTPAQYRSPLGRRPYDRPTVHDQPGCSQSGPRRRVTITRRPLAVPRPSPSRASVRRAAALILPSVSGPVRRQLRSPAVCGADSTPPRIYPDRALSDVRLPRIDRPPSVTYRG